jgi:hypothetical protein
MHSVCGKDHDPAVACPPPAEPATTRTEWGVLRDEDVVERCVTEANARRIARNHRATVVYRTVTLGPWTEAPPWDDHEEPA